MEIDGPHGQSTSTRSQDIHVPVSLTAIRTWAASLKGQILLPADVAYETARHIWNRDIDRHPTVIVCCADEADVVRSVDFARTRGLRIAVRAGGHSQAGHSVCDAGMVIDLGGLARGEVDTRTRIARIGGGMRVGAMLDLIGAFGLATPAGTCPDVGVAGLTLGGGEGMLMARYGVTCDNLIAARIVTARGRVETASAEENADLYWAIRGGGGNFGIATMLEFRLHPLDRVLSGRMIFPVTRAADAMRRYRDLMASAPDEWQTSGGLAFSEKESTFFIEVCHCGDPESAAAVVERWRNTLQPDSDTVEAMRYPADFSLPAVASSGGGSFLPELTDDVINVLAEHFSDAPPACTAAWNDYHGAVTRVPRHAMAFPLRDPGYDLFVHATWNSDAARQDALAWMNSLLASVRPWQRGVYVNNLGIESAEQTAAAYGENFERLTRIKAQYDPDNVFRSNHNIRPSGAGVEGE